MADWRIQGNVSNPAQNRGPSPVIVQLSEIVSISGEPRKGKIDGTVSSFSQSAAGFRMGIPWNVAGDT